MNKMTRNTLTFEGKKYVLKENDSALDAMLSGGANVAFSCRKGSCRSCMLEAVSGDPGVESQATLTPEMRRKGLFLPCMARNVDAVEAQVPDLSKWFSKAVVTEKNQLSDQIWQLQLEPTTEMTWRAGQYLNMRNASGDVRSYSIASISPDDYFIELHIMHYPDGALSNWVVESLQPGDVVDIQGPIGTCYYDDDMQNHPLLLMGTGTGAAPLIGIAREALAKGHSAPIHFYHGALEAKNLYLFEKLTEMEVQYPNFHMRCTAKNGPDNQPIEDIVFGEHTDLQDYIVFFAGSPDMVEGARINAVYHGASVNNIHSDPFDAPGLYQPCDKQKIDACKPDPELWDALRKGDGLTDILHDFYEVVYNDARLSPFFHNVTKSRAVEKQYDFLRDLITGSREFFGERPFNSHHWMVISDELFDYRETVFFAAVKRYGLAPHLINHWAAMHEMFRRELVKSAPRGIYRDGVEHYLEGYLDEEIIVDTVCDGCYAEISVGETARMLKRTGELFCLKCGGE